MLITSKNVHIPKYRVSKKNFTKVVGYNFACVLSFLMKFGYVIGICKFLPKKFQGSSSKNDEKIAKKLFFKC